MKRWFRQEWPADAKIGKWKLIGEQNIPGVLVLGLHSFKGKRNTLNRWLNMNNFTSPEEEQTDINEHTDLLPAIT
jgi:hypothetical protein